jgi:NADPH-dependent curcumin reductase CurA
MTAKVNHQWRVRARPVGMIQESDFAWHEEPIASVGPGQVLVRNIYLSLDPANRAWLYERGSYMEPVALGQVMRGIAIGVVEESRDGRFRAGDLVQGMLGWQEYAVCDAAALGKAPKIPSLPLIAYFGLLGHIGLTAYFGLVEIGRPQAGETLVVTAAAGAVGSIAGQIGKILGCRVVGIAGSVEKCRWITDELGFDAAINYKTEPVSDGLQKHCPNGIDIDFENVGGEILDAILGRINLRARIVICGLISQYNATAPVPGPYNFSNLLMKRARAQGFIVSDYLDRKEPAVAKLIEWHKEGRIRYRTDLVTGLGRAPQAINRLFAGSNRGKLIVKVSEEP